MTAPRLPFLFVVGFCVLTGATGVAQEIPSVFDGVDRIVAIGDVHGAYDRFVANLEATGLVDRKLRWTGGTTHLVQTGDVLDRGPHSRRVMDLLMDLEPQAVEAGGRVHVLIGNHEFWNVVGDLRYVSREEFSAFDGSRDRELRKEQTVPTRPGYLAHREAFSRQGAYGRWIRGLNAAVKINDIVFVHGGITPLAAELGLEEINRRVRAELDAPEGAWKRSWSLSPAGPLMTRRFSQLDMTPSEKETIGKEIEHVLSSLDARTLVMGHTVSLGLITPRFDGRAILIDTGMLGTYVEGRQAALVIESDASYAIYARGKVALPPQLAGDAGARYIEKVAAASPADPAVKHRLALLRAAEGRHREAVELYRRIGALEPENERPLAWYKDAGRSFETLGETARAEKLYLVYLNGLRENAEITMGPEGFLLHHQFARECLRLGFLEDEALEAALRVERAAPRNLTFKSTLARAYLHNGEPERALGVLAKILARDGDRFEVQYLLGRAHAMLGNEELALDALRRALEYQPNDPQAVAALESLARAAR